MVLDAAALIRKSITISGAVRWSSLDAIILQSVLDGTYEGREEKSAYDGVGPTKLRSLREWDCGAVSTFIGTI